MNNKIYSMLVKGLGPTGDFPRGVSPDAPELPAAALDLIFGARALPSSRLWRANQLCQAAMSDHRVAAALLVVDPVNDYMTRSGPARPSAVCSGLAVSKPTYLREAARWVVLEAALTASTSSATLGTESCNLSWAGGMSSPASFPRAGVSIRIYGGPGSGELKLVKPEPLDAAALLASMRPLVVSGGAREALARPGQAPLEAVCSILIDMAAGL
jgi:hypothetical protein